MVRTIEKMSDQTKQPGMNRTLPGWPDRLE